MGNHNSNLANSWLSEIGSILIRQRLRQRGLRSYYYRRGNILEDGDRPHLCLF